MITRLMQDRRFAAKTRARGRFVSGTAVLRALIALAMLPAMLGCSLWRGDLDPEFERRLDERLRDISLANFEKASRGEPTTVEQGLAALNSTEKPEPAIAAAESIDLAIDQVRLHVLRNNLDLAIYSIDPAIAAAKISEEEAKFDATINVGASFKRKDLPALDGDVVQIDEKSSLADKAVKAFNSGLAGGKSSGGSSSLDGVFAKFTEIEQQKEYIDLSFGVTVPLPTGARIRVGQGFDRDTKLSPFPSDQTLSTTGFSLSQPLLRDAGIDVNLASIRIARLNSKSTVARTKLVAIRLLAAAEKAYWKLYGARQLLEVRRQLDQLAKQNLEIVIKRADEGLVAPVEKIRAEVGVALQREALIIAETVERIQERDLKRVLNIDGVDIKSSTRMNIVTPPRLLQYQLDADALAADALAHRMEMLEMELAIAADDLRIEFAKNQTLPLISLDFEYGIVDRGGTFGTAWQGAWDFDNSEYGIGIKGEIPVTNELRKSRLRQAVLTRTQRLATRAARELAIRQEVYDALDTLNQNWQRILAARQAAILSGMNYEAERKQFDQGTRTMREVFEALAQLGEAQSREIAAVVAYQVSLVDLAFATGTLMGYSKVDVLEANFVR